MTSASTSRPHELMDEILNLTMKLKSSYPAIYEHLDETPLFPSQDTDEGIKAMEDYRNTLLALLDKHKQ